MVNSDIVSKRLKLLLLKDVQEDLGKQIGKGAYCTVTKMKFRGLTCAGKKFHNILVEDVSDQEEKRALFERFADECELLSRLHHPNFRTRESVWRYNWENCAQRRRNLLSVLPT